MVPVAISLLGSGQDRATIAFVGWFGPRGLASVVFALLAVEELGGTDPRVVAAVHTIAITILLSVVAHGITARPLGHAVSSTATSTPCATPVARSRSHGGDRVGPAAAGGESERDTGRPSG